MTPTSASLLADAILYLHALVVAFVVLALPLTWFLVPVRLRCSGLLRCSGQPPL